MLWKIAFVAALAVGVIGESQYDITEDQRQQVQNAITEVCKKNNAEDKAPDVVTSIKTFGDCVKGLFNAETIKQEIEEAKPRGALDEVFKKYCDKSGQLKACISNALTGVTPCVPDDLKVHLPAATNATDKLIDFVCYKDGDRIALFIAEGGPECFKAQADSIKSCVETVRGSITTPEQAKNLSLREKCQKYDALTTCVVSKLENCQNPTPANMAESMLNFIKKATPCNGL